MATEYGVRRVAHGKPYGKVIPVANKMIAEDLHRMKTQRDPWAPFERKWAAYQREKGTRAWLYFKMTYREGDYIR